MLLLRRVLSAVGQIEDSDPLQRLATTKTNREFLARITKAMEAEKN